jgi:large subunit ribosomal protein L3
LTVIELGPCVVVQVKTKKTDGYEAICLGFGERDLRKFNKPRAGVFKKVLGEKTKVGFRLLREVNVKNAGEYAVGQTLTVEQYAAGDWIDVIGKSKGKGFAGTIKRHHFASGPKSHGSKNVREPGSIGCHTYPARVFKGKRMAGHLGAKRITVQRLKVHQVDPQNNLLFVVGAVPGPKRGMVMVQPSLKA